ncbi:MAG: DUF4920 domain-containing protein [Bacteroidota bacterium]
MKFASVFFAFALLMGLSSLQAQKMSFPEDSVSADGNKSYHGLRIDEAGAVALSELPATLESHDPAAPIKVTGEIDAACKVKGCWMTMALPNGEDMRVKFKDYGFFVPTDAAGDIAVMEGIVAMDTLSVEEARHLAEDAGMSEEEAEETITEPKVELSFEATGVIVKSSK